MTRNRSFIRKLVYLCAMAILLAPISWLSAPAVYDAAARKEKGGGQLAQLRIQYKLSQASLGEIDPTSETIKLATLGMRGVASTMLWQKAHQYKMTEDWTNLSTTLEQITKLQPNFIVVWQYQSWNLSYNVSTQFDDYHDRYYWVIRGLNFLEDGTHYNEDNPNLLWDMGWFLGHKIGASDEKYYFRDLFKHDDEYHAKHHPADLPPDQRDNWLVGKYWFLKAQNARDTTGKPVKGRTELIFQMYPALWQSNYADWLERDGKFGEIARKAWATASEDWRLYGERPIPADDNIPIQLGKLDYFKEEAKSKRAELEALSGGIAESMRKELKKQLTDDERLALEIDPDLRNDEQAVLAEKAEKQIRVPAHELAKRIKEAFPAQGFTALSLADEVVHAEIQVDLITTNRPSMNYEYWVTRSELEQTDQALQARELIHKGDQELESGDPKKARGYYDQAFALWRIVLDRYPSIVTDPFTGDQFMQVIERYVRILKEDGKEQFSPDFPLRDVVEWHDQEGKFRGMLGASTEATGSDDNSGAEQPAAPLAPGGPPEPPPLTRTGA